VPEHPPSKSLRTLLLERGALIDQEEQIFADPAVAVLSPEEQLAFLASNRRVGFYVTAFAGGVRVLLVLAGAFAYVAATIDGAIPFGWWSPLIGIALVILVGWLVPAFVRALAARRRALPSWEELAPSLR
jgi:hypothetical protein